jgi:hypothetical protein
MRYAAALLTLFVISGCAHKHSAKVASVAVPQKCILGGIVNKAKCEPLGKDEMVCNAVVVKFACVEVKQ